jgi:hypothetical protein
MGVLVNVFEKDCEADIYEDDDMNSDCDENNNMEEKADEKKC